MLPLYVKPPKNILVFLVISIVLILTTSPYFLVTKFAPLSLGKIDGISSDINSYLADMQEGFQGKWCYLNPYTSGDHPCEYLFLFYLFLGHLARWLSLSLPLTYTLAKIPATIFLLLVSWWFCGLFLKDFKKRFFAFLAICFSGGLGWIIFVPPSLYNFLWENFKTLFLPTDIWLAETSTFLLLLGPPHFALGQGFLHLSLGLILKMWKTKRTVKKLTYFLAAVFSANLMGVFHPYLVLSFVVISLGFVTVTTLFYKKLIVKNLLLVAFLGFSLVPLVVYHYKALVLNPIMSGWTIQNIIRSPFPLSYILGYGLIFIFALKGAFETVKNINISNLFLLSYPAFNFLLLYFPVNFQAKLVEGLHVPLCILATNGFFAWKEKFVHSEKKKILGLLIYLSLVGNIGIFGNILLSLRSIFTEEFKTYAGCEEKAFAWLSLHTSPQEAVLAAFDTGNAIPAYTGSRVYLGHAHITPNSKLKNEKIKQFLKGGKVKREKEFLAANNIKYVYSGKEEEELIFVPLKDRPYLEKVFESGQISIYKVKL